MEPTGGDWKVACDSYGRVRHSRKACIYTVLREADGTERLVTIAARIPNWSDAKLMAHAPALAWALRQCAAEPDAKARQVIMERALRACEEA